MEKELNIVALLRSYKNPIIVFISSRILVFAVYYLSSFYGVGAKLFQWDANGYLSIARNGYIFNGDYAGIGSYIGFFPLYPIIVRVLSIITTIDVSFSALIVSFISGLIATILLYELVEKWAGKEAGLNASFLFSFFPMSVFLSSAYTESLFSLIILSAFLAIQRKKFFLASFFVSLSLITRITGFILLPIFIFEFYRYKKSVVLSALVSLLTLIPFYIYILFQYIKYNNPLAFLTVQKINWFHQTAFPWDGFIDFIRYVPSDIMYRVDLFFLVIMTLTLLGSFRNLNKNLIFFGLGIIVLSFCETFVLGLSRYLMLVLPFYFFWGKFLTKHYLLREVIFMFSASWLAFNTVLFVYSFHIF